MTTAATRAIGLGMLAAVLALATACGGEPGPARPADQPPTVPTGAPPPGSPSVTTGRPVPAPDPLTADPPAGTQVVPGEQVDATALPPGFPRLVWTRGDRVVGMYGRAGGCTEARAEVLEQTADHVAVRVVQYAARPGPCTRELRYPPLEVTLQEGLGARRVVLSGVIEAHP